MNLLKNFRLKVKINIVILSVSFSTVVLGFSIFSYNTINTYKTNLIDNGILTARLVGEFALIPLTYQEEDRAFQTLLKLKQMPDIQNCMIYDEYGKLFVSYNQKKDNLVHNQSLFTDSTYFEGKYLHIYQPINFQAVRYGIIYLRISTKSLNYTIGQHGQMVGLVMALLLIFSLFISNYVQGVISSPIINLARFTAKISEKGTEGERILHDTPDEIGELYQNFNYMLGQIEKRQAENNEARIKLKENHRQLIEIIDAIPQLIYIKDINNRYLLANKRLCDLFNVLPSELIGKTQKEIAPWFSFELDKTRELDKVINKHDSIFIPEAEFSDYMGNTAFLQLTKLPFMYNGQNSLLGVGVDITGVLRAENALRESQELFAVFMDMLPAATFIKNSDSKYLYVNEYLKRNFEAQLWIDNLVVINTDKDLSRVISEDKKAIEAATSFEEILLDKHGNLRHYETWKFPVKRKDKEPLIGGIAVEITHRKRAEKKINFFIDELKRNNQELAEFNYVASHDLREPLRTLTSYCELLKEDAGDNLNNDAKEDLEFIVNAARRMNALIQDLLELSRAGRVDMNRRKTDLNKCATNAVKDLDSFIKEKNAQVTIEKLPEVIGDEMHLTRVFQNLIHNAIKFNNSKKPIVKIIVLDQTEYQVKISVEDNGIGIDEEFQLQVFAPFKRLHPSGKYEGTGIGLAICKKIIERHGGKIELYSKPNNGSKFTFSIKIAEEKTQ
jgi:PAS domain S-box-containing protein